MYNVRIKKNARAGDQKDFSLHSGLDAVYSPTSGVSAQSSVKHTMGASSRDEANIEVEGRETVVGDVNNDGYVELFEFKGKRHSKGGMLVNIPEGSFIFSDTKKLTIKDRALLKELFDKSGKKSGYTPAEISKQYKLNHFMATLRDEKADKISKGTADLMVKKNMRKLGELALVQESMKGFPTGIPAIAELAMGPEGSQGQGQEQTPQMKRGGVVLPKMNGGGGTSGEAVRNGQTSYVGKLMNFVSASLDASSQKPKPKPVSSSGNSKMDSLISEYYKNPSKEKARQLQEIIKQSYPESFALLMPGYNANGVIDNDYVKKAYFHAQSSLKDTVDNRNDHQKAKDKARELQPQVTEKISELQSNLEASRSNLLPHEIKKAEAEINNLNFHYNKGEYNILSHALGLSQKSSEDSQPTDNRIPFITKSTQADQNPKPYYENVSNPVQNTPQTGATRQQIDDRAAFMASTGSAKTQPTELSADKAPVKPAPKSVQKIGSYQLEEDEEIIGMFRNGGLVKYNLAGTVSDSKVTFVYNKKTKTYKVVDTASGNIVFNTYSNPGDKTPGGMDSSYPDMAPEEFVNWFKGWTIAMKIEPNQLQGNEDFQERMYNYTLENDPEYVEKIWSETGLNSKALKDSGLLTKLIDSNAYNPETNKLDFSKLDADTKFTLFKEMTPYYKDGMVGVRSLNQKPPVVEDFDPELVSEVVSAVTPEKQERLPGDTSANFNSDDPMAQAPVKKNGPWYIQDQMNFMAAMTDPINRYEPMLGQIDMETPDVVFKDPSRMIAASQEQQAGMRDMISNSMDPNTAAAMSIGSSAEGFANTANVIAQTENENVGTANQAAMNNAQIQNNERAYNNQGLQKYVGEMAMLNQNLDDSVSQRKYRQLATWNNGTSNWHRKKIMEQVLFPQVYQDPMSGDISYSGNKRDPFGFDNYENPGMSTASINPLEEAKNQIELFRSLKQQGYTDDELAFWRNQRPAQKPKKSNQPNNYANAMLGVVPQNVQVTPDYEDGE